MSRLTLTGSGLAAFDPSALLTHIASYWTLNEGSGDGRNDSHGANHLVENGSIGTVDATTGVLDNAALFTASRSEFLSGDNHESLQTGDIDFTFACWVKLASKGSDRHIASKWTATGSQREWRLYFRNDLDRFAFAKSNNGSSTAVVTANTFGSPSLDTWYFVTAWHDANADKMGIQINDGTADIQTTIGGVLSGGTSDFALGCIFSSAGTGSQFWNGAIDEAGFWRRVLSGAERSYLYNNGVGRTYPFV